MSARDNLRARVARAIHKALYPVVYEDDLDDMRPTAYLAADAAIREVVEARAKVANWFPSRAGEAASVRVAHEIRNLILALAQEHKTKGSGDV